MLTYGDRHPHTGRYVALLRHRLQKEGKSGQGGDGEGGRVDPVYERTGAPAHAAYAAAQLWRLAAEEPVSQGGREGCWPAHRGQDTCLLA